MTRIHRVRIAFLISGLLLGVLSSPASLAQQSAANSEIYVVPFSHLDLYWACTQEECLSRGNYVISKAIQLAMRYPQYRYHLEADNFLANFVDSHRGTKELENLHELVKQGRIEIAPLWAEIYQNQTRDEALVRNLIYGKRFAREVFGVDPTVAQLSDIPGFTRQYPQILRQAGVPYMVMTRMGPRDLPLFRWKAPDGSSALVWNAIHGYWWGVDLGLHQEMTQKRLDNIGKDVKDVSVTTSSPIFINWGMDLYAPSEKVIDNIPVLNQRLAPLHFRLATPQEFFRAAAATPNIPELAGEIPSSWANITTSLIPLWTSALSATDALVSAEKFAAVNDALGYAPYPDKTFESLWKENLLSLDHNNDGQGGEIGDERKLGHARSAWLGAGQILRDSLRNIAERVQTAFPRSTPIVVFNPLSWRRDNFVQTHVTLFGDVITSDIDDYKKGLRLQDEKGAAIPFQVEQYTDGSSRALDLVFTAAQVPSVGYKTYYLVPASESQTFPNACEVKLQTDDLARDNKDALGADVLENAFYQVSVDRATGRIDVFDKQLQQWVSKGLEISAVEERGGDDQNIILPSGRTIINSVALIAVEENSTVRTVVRIDGNLGGVPTTQRLTMYRDLKQIDIEDTIDWKAGRSMNIEQIFPILQKDAEARVGIPYGAAATPDIMPQAGPRNGDEVAPQIWKQWRQIQGWVFAGTRDWGFTVSADHNLVAVSDRAVRAEMLRGTRFTPAVTAKDGQTLPALRPPAGVYIFRFSFTSGKGDWTAQKSWRAGMALSAPLIPVVALNPLSDKLLPPEQSFFSLGADNLVLTAIKKSESGENIVVRAFEIQGKATSSSLRFLGQERRFHATNLLEEETPKGEQSVLQFDPYEIDTLTVVVGEQSK